MQQGNGELVLVVDDEIAIREVTKSTLETYGYNVLLAANGQEAVSVFAQHMNEITLVLTDLVMPVMDGIAAIHAMQNIKSDVKIIAVTAFIDDVRFTDLLGDIEAVLRKPYTVQVLLETIGRVLNPS